MSKMITYTDSFGNSVSYVPHPDFTDAEPIPPLEVVPIAEAYPGATNSFDPERCAELKPNRPEQGQPELNNMSETTLEMITKEEAIARVCHEANKLWCEANQDFSQKSWNEAEPWQRDSAIKGVQFRFENPDAKEDSQHNAWMKDKIDQGWVYGEVKDAEKKTHPCIVPFDQLPKFQQKKDALFCAIVDALK